MAHPHLLMAYPFGVPPLNLPCRNYARSKTRRLKSMAVVIIEITQPSFMLN